eukprot:m.442417 g.442417  ORF g.442417 m.442417 type:complete len:91 (-) comp131369_c0_seq1:176-448(-)
MVHHTLHVPCDDSTLTLFAAETTPDAGQTTRAVQISISLHTRQSVRLGVKKEAGRGALSRDESAAEGVPSSARQCCDACVLQSGDGDVPI